jgi:hypothetical protein
MQSRCLEIREYQNLIATSVIFNETYRVALLWISVRLQAPLIKQGQRYKNIHIRAQIITNLCDVNAVVKPAQ